MVGVPGVGCWTDCSKLANLFRTECHAICSWSKAACDKAPISLVFDFGSFFDFTNIGALPPSRCYVSTAVRCSKPFRQW